MTSIHKEMETFTSSSKYIVRVTYFSLGTRKYQLYYSPRFIVRMPNFSLGWRRYQLCRCSSFIVRISNVSKGIIRYQLWQSLIYIYIFKLPILPKSKFYYQNSEFLFNYKKVLLMSKLNIYICIAKFKSIYKA